MASRPLRRTLVGLTIALVVPQLFVFLRLSHELGLGRLGGEFLWWGLWACLLLYVRKVERRPLASIGLCRLQPQSFLAASLTAAIVIAIDLAAFTVLSHLPGPASLYLNDPPWLLTLVALRGAVVEETLFRGYGIERIEELTGTHWIAGAVTLAAFALPHFAGGNWAHLVTALYGGAAFTLLYFWRRSLLGNILAHGLTNLLPLLVLVSLRA